MIFLAVIFYYTLGIGIWNLFDDAKETGTPMTHFVVITLWPAIAIYSAIMWVKGEGL